MCWAWMARPFLCISQAPAKILKGSELLGVATNYPRNIVARMNSMRLELMASRSFDDARKRTLGIL